MDILNEKHLQELAGQISKIDKLEHLSWLHGYLTGLIQQKQSGVILPSNSHEVIQEVVTEEFASFTILYGTQSGNSKKVANQLFEKVQAEGLKVKLSDMADYNPRELKNEKNIFVVVSTQGDGEPPLSAEELLDYLQSKKAQKLEHINYSVLALGDKGYVNFCKTGADFDASFEKLGAQRLVERIDCDVAFQKDADKWIELVIAKAKSLNGTKISKPAVNGNIPHVIKKSNLFTRENPGKLLVSESVILNGRGSEKNTIHLELSAEGQDFDYNPGDSLGIYFQNPESLVEEILQFLKVDASEKVNWQAQEYTISELLLHKTELTQLSRDVLQQYNEFAQVDTLSEILKDVNSLSSYIYGRDVLDLLQEYPVALNAQQFISILRPMQARLYSIASSPLYVQGEVHIAVDVLNYEFLNRRKYGACSGYVSSALEVGSYIDAFVSGNESFRLPDQSKDIIMIGPGTGVAPFRSFIQHREAENAAGRNWLFFGSQHFTTDFLYQTEWQKYKKENVLHRLDLAFSRDQQEKVYVQHRMRERSKELFSWLEGGAHIYVCGDKSRMAKDVHASLIEIIQKEGGLSEEKAAEYVKNLRKQRRYLEDVY